MIAIQTNMLQSLRAIEQFLNDNAAEFSSVVNTGTRQRLTRIIAALETHKSDQNEHGVAIANGARQQYELRKQLIRDHMAPIARIARADIPQAPNISGFRLPRGVPGVEKLTAYADGMAKAAVPYTGIFVGAGLAPDFITQLQRASAALINMRTKRTTISARRTGATKSLKSNLTAGRKVVHVLDAFIQTALLDKPTLLTNWNAVKRVQLTGTLGRTAAAPEVPSTPTQEVPQSAAA